MTTTMPARLLTLLSLLQGRREWSGADLADRLAVTDRTVRRDVDRLRELGYRVEGTTGTAGGYRLVAGRDLPPLLLDDDEAVAITVALRTASGVAGIEEAALRALAKLEQVLPARLRGRVVGEAIVSVPGSGARAVDAGVLTVLATACRDHEIVRFTHRSRDGDAAERRVEPHRILTSRGYWYLLAFDPGRDGWRTFRADRITDPVPVRLRFSPRDAPADVVAHLRATITDAPYRFSAVATVRATAAEVQARLPDLIPGRITPVDDGTCTVRLGADDPALVMRHLLAIDAPYTLDADAELRTHLRGAAQRLRDALDRRSRAATVEP